MPLTPEDRVSLMKAVDRCHDTFGSGIVFLGEDDRDIVRRPPMTSSYFDRHASGLIERYRNPALSALRMGVAVEVSSGPRQNDPVRKNKLSAELMQMGVGCGAFYFFSVGSLSLTAVTPATMGASAIPLPVTTALAAAAGTQCTVSAVRVTDEIFNDGSWSDYMDRSAGYVWGMRGLDALSIGGIVGGPTLWLGAKGARHWTNLNSLKQDLLNSFSDVLSLSSSAIGGTLNEISVWLFGSE